MNIYLIGYRGTGKTTVARLLAARLGWPVVDADERLEQTAGRSIAEIFAADGEKAFRDLESSVLEQLATRNPCVISLGGGVELRERNREVLRGGRVVWLRAPAAELWARITRDPTSGGRRPNLTASGGLAEVEQLLNAREPFYRQCADLIVETADVSAAEVADRIARWQVEEDARWTSG